MFQLLSGNVESTLWIEMLWPEFCQKLIPINTQLQKLGGPEWICCMLWVLCIVLATVLQLSVHPTVHVHYAAIQMTKVCFLP